VDFYAWTPGTLSFMGLTSKGVALPAVTVSGRFSLTPLHGAGPVTLVAPSSLAQRRTVSFTKLVLFFPEPGTWLFFAAAGLGMLWTARRR